MPYDWTTSPDKSQTLRLWPHNSLPPRGAAAWVLLIFSFATIPLIAVLGSVLLWGLLPFVLLAVGGMWLAIEMNYRQRRILEVLTLSDSQAHLIRHNPKGTPQEARAILGDQPDAASLHLALIHLVAGLHDGHAFVMAPEFVSLGKHRWPFTLVDVTEGVMAHTVQEELEGVEVGWVLERIGDIDLAEWRQARAGMGPRAIDFRINGLLTSGLTGATTTLALRDHDDQPVERQVRWASSDQLTAQIGNLPPFGVDVRSERVHDDVHLFAINAFMPPIMEPWAETVALAVRDGVSGMIIDLRGNPGGVSGLSVGMASYLVSEPGQVLGTMISRDSTFNFLVSPRPQEQRFEGSVAVLIDSMSASTSEILAGGLKGIERARVFGENSAGMALPSTFETLPNGDRLQLVLADLVGPDGERLEGSGVEPHERIPLSRDALRDGDPVIAAAISWIVEDEE